MSGCVSIHADMSRFAGAILAMHKCLGLCLGSEFGKKTCIIFCICVVFVHLVEVQSTLSVVVFASAMLGWCLAFRMKMWNFQWSNRNPSFGWRLRESVVSSDVWMKDSNYMMMEYSLFNPWKLSIGNLFLVIFFAKQIQIQHFPTLEALSMSSERPIYSIDLVSLAQHFGCTSMEQLIVLISRSISEVWRAQQKLPGFYKSSMRSIRKPSERIGNEPRSYIIKSSISWYINIYHDASKSNTKTQQKSPATWFWRLHTLQAEVSLAGWSLGARAATWTQLTRFVKLVKLRSLVSKFSKFSTLRPCLWPTAWSVVEKRWISSIPWMIVGSFPSRPQNEETNNEEKTNWRLSDRSTRWKSTDLKDLWMFFVLLRGFRT